MSVTSNCFPIVLSDHKSIHLYRLPYTPELLNKLRLSHNHTHSFFRADEYIYISPMSQNDVVLGEKVKIDISQNQKIISSLIRHALFRGFRDTFKHILPLSSHPLRFLSTKHHDDIIYSALPNNLRSVLSRPKMIEVQVREITEDNICKFGVVISIEYRWKFDKNCQDLFEEGYNVVGLEVAIPEEIPTLSGIIAPEDSFIGTIISTNEGYATIDTNEGTRDLSLTDLVIHKSSRQIREYLEFKIGEVRTNKVFSIMKAKDKSRLDAQIYYQDVLEIAKTLSKVEYHNLLDFEFNINPTPLPITQSISINKPTFVFDPSLSVSTNDPSKGLIDYGPYDSLTFSDKKPLMLVICHKDSAYVFSQFLGKLADGIATASNFKNGMIGKYKLDEMEFEFVELNDYSTEEYKNRITDAIRNMDVLPSLAFIETKEDFRRLRPQNNPYYRSKAYFLQHGIPVQAAEVDTLIKGDNDLRWVCDSVALQIYAKLGGRPWALRADNSIEHEIVVGIGSSIERNNLMSSNTQKRIVGITTFFTGDGKYLFGNKCKEVPFEDYFDELLNNLRDSIDDISMDYGWNTKEKIRLIFHIFKPIKNVEADVVEKLINEYQDYDIQYCFVTISEQHPFLLFDPHVKTGKKGNFVPSRTSNWILDDSSCLLQVLGTEDMVTSRHGFSSPLLIRIHPKSSYRDLSRITQQVYNFTFLSWRGFRSSLQPSSLLFAELIAKLLSRLKNISSWTPEVVNNKLRDKKWFL